MMNWKWWIENNDWKWWFENDELKIMNWKWWFHWILLAFQSIHGNTGFYFFGFLFMSVNFLKYFPQNAHIKFDRKYKRFDQVSLIFLFDLKWMNIHVSNQLVLCLCIVIFICFDKSKKCHELPFKGASRGAGKGIVEVYFLF